MMHRIKSLQSQLVKILFLTLFLSTGAQANQKITIENSDPKSYPYRNSLLIFGTGISTWAMMSDRIAGDKKRHFGLSILFGAASESLLRANQSSANHRWLRIAYATGLGTVPGIIKEATDPVFDQSDLIADILGAFAGAVMSDLLQGPTSDQLISTQISGDKFAISLAFQF